MGAWQDSPAVKVTDGTYAGRTGQLNWQSGTRVSVYLIADAEHCETCVVLPLKLVEIGVTPAPDARSILTVYRSGQ